MGLFTTFPTDTPLSYNLSHQRENNAEVFYDFSHCQNFRRKIVDILKEYSLSHNFTAYFIVKLKMIFFNYRPENAIKMKLTSFYEISMDKFDLQWKIFLKRSNFLQYYCNNVGEMRRGVRQVACWYESILRSQFNSSRDQHDR